MSKFIGDAFWHDYITLEVAEYSSTSVITKKKRAKLVKPPKLSAHLHKSTFKFSVFRLSVAVAKSILTRDPTDTDLLKEVRASFYQLDSMLDSKSDELRVTKGFRRKYRDFSKTSRTGELAQGLTFLFSQEVLRYPLILDFHGFLESQKIPLIPTDDQSPDFALIFKNGAKSPSLIESKGACPPSKSLAVKEELNEALTQCDSADKHIFAHATPAYNVVNTFGALTLLAEVTDKWSSLLAFCDPENEPSGGMAYPMEAASRYFAAWLTIAGRVKLAEELLSGNQRLGSFEQFKLLLIGGTNYRVFPADRSTMDLFTPFKGFRSQKVQPIFPSHWLIREDILKAVLAKDESAFLKLIENLEIRQAHEDDNGQVYFADGTMCLMKGHPELGG